MADSVANHPHPDHLPEGEGDLLGGFSDNLLVASFARLFFSIRGRTRASCAMHFAFIVIVALSLVVQVATALLAMRLIRITGTSRAWMVIAAAMLAMAIRRLIVLIGVIPDFSDLARTEFWSEAVGLFNAVLLLAGIAAIAPLFRTIQRAKETTEQARDQLEHEVRQRTADLAGAHEKLQAEFAQRAKAEAALRDEHRRLQQVLEISASAISGC